MKKIAFFIGADGDTFIKPIIEYLKQFYECAVYSHKNITDISNPDGSHVYDLAWYEWATDIAYIASKSKCSWKKIVRLHRYEAYTQWMARIHWGNIDLLINVGNDFVTERIKKVVNDRCRIRTIPNGVDVEKFSYQEKPNNKKIAFIGNMRDVKNFPLMIYCMAELVKKEPEFKLHWAGKVYDQVIFDYCFNLICKLGLQDNIIADQWQDDMVEWLRDKQYVLCTSMIESQGMGIMEAMATGCIPLIHEFPGVESIYKEYMTFKATGTFTECVEIYEKCPDSVPDIYASYWVSKNYNSQKTMVKVKHEIERLIGE